MTMQRVELLLRYGVLAMFSLLIIYPLLGIVALAVDPRGPLLSAIQLPEAITLETLTRAWDVGRMGVTLRNSAIVAGLVALACVLLSTLAGFAFASLRFAGSNAIFYLFLIGMIMPLEAYLIPLYYQLRGAGLIDTYPGLIVPLTAMSLPFGVFWMRASCRAVPSQLVDAARIDGAGHVAVLRHVVLPLIVPALTTLLVLTFVFTWNDFLLSLVVVTSASMQTAPLGLALFIGQWSTDQAGLAAGALLISLPTLVVFLVFQRTLVRGILAGALKE
jgi:raffinose/stachyose/melibiose transport system permease protein